MLLVIPDERGGKPRALALDAALYQGVVTCERLSVAERLSAGDYLATFIDDEENQTPVRLSLAEALGPGYYAESELRRADGDR
jgi:hypothetical protein